MLSHAKFDIFSTNAAPLIIQPLPYRENIRIGHLWQRHARSRVNRVIVIFDKLTENAAINTRIFIGETFLEPIANGSMISIKDGAINVGIFTRLKPDVLMLQNACLKIICNCSFPPR